MTKNLYMHIKSAEFVMSNSDVAKCPKALLPEYAFIGRSNVGKSSLINALTNRNGLARASNTPGRTQELNFFDVGNPALFRIVDMPGYGYAKAPVATVKKWRYLINDYLRGRVVLKRVFVLIDSRHGIKDVDKEILDMLDTAAMSYRIVLTKTDKIKASELEKIRSETQAAMTKRAAAFPEMSITSAEKKGGIDDLRTAVLEAVYT